MRYLSMRSWLSLPEEFHKKAIEMFKEVSGTAEDAVQLLKAKRYGAAELIGRSVIVNNGDNWPQALMVLGQLSCLAGNLSDLEAYSMASHCSSIHEAKESLDTRSSRAISRKTRNKSRDFLIVTARGNGFWSDVSHVVGCALLSEITNRILVVHWGKKSYYSDDQNQDAFKSFFLTSSEWNLESDDLTSLVLTSPSETLALPCDAVENCKDAYSVMRSTSAAVLCDGYVGVPFAYIWNKPMFWPSFNEIKNEWARLSSKYLVPNLALKQMVDSFITEQFGGSPYSSIHIRGSDKIIEDEDLYKTNEQIIRMAAVKIPDSHKMFLLTDDSKYVDRIVKEYGSRIVVSDATRTDSLMGVHRYRAFQTGKEYASGKALGFEILLDTYVALKSAMFFGNGRSNVSCVIDLMGDFNVGKSHLINSNQLTQMIDWNDTLLE